MKASARNGGGGGGGGSGGGNVVLSWLSVQMHRRSDDEVRLCSCRNDSERYSPKNHRKRTQPEHPNNFIFIYFHYEK